MTNNPTAAPLALACTLLKAAKRIAIYYAILCCFCIFACKSEKENIENGKIKRIISGIIVEEFHNYSFSDDTNSVYIVGGDTVSVRYISEYDSTGNIVRFSIHKPEGPLEYSLEELMADTALFKYTGGKNAKDWIFLSRMTITNKIDTLELRSHKDRFGNRIHEYRKGNNITIFEY